MRLSVHEEIRQVGCLVAAPTGSSAQGDDEDVQAPLDRGQYAGHLVLSDRLDVVLLLDGIPDGLLHVPKSKTAWTV